jgi:hypothetical protein
MKALNILIPLILISMAVGCKSHEAQTVSSASTISPQMTEAPLPPQRATASVPQPAATNGIPQQITTDKAIYTIRVLPNPRLSATSREGDKTNEVYSSNIIAVYVQPRNGVTVDSTNLPSAPSRK